MKQTPSAPKFPNHFRAIRTHTPLFFALASAFLASACQTATKSTPDATVTPAQFERALAIVADTRSYVDWHEIGTCEPRALLLSALLASERIPSSVVKVTPPNGSTLYGPGGAPWNYHIAVMLRAADTAPMMMIDPALSDDPMLLTDWRSALRADSARLEIAPGSVTASALATYAPSDVTSVPESFDTMPAFALSDIEQSCGIIARWQPNIPGVDVSAARSRLHRETVRVVAALRALDKLDLGDLAPGSVYCGREKIIF